MADPVKVDIPRMDLISTQNPDTVVIGKLKEAGIPAKGERLFSGVGSGKLTKTVNFALDRIEYTWEP